MAQHTETIIVSVFCDMALQLNSLEMSECKNSTTSSEVLKLKKSFYGTLCHVCNVPDVASKKLKRCSACKMISYCCSQHQKMHWPMHKKICKCIQSTLMKVKFQSLTLFNNSNVSPQLSIEEWISLRSNSMLLVELAMNRKLFRDEREMFLFPRVCEVCRDIKQETLSDCKFCKSVSYCSTRHRLLDQDRHNPLCSLLDLCRRMDTRIPTVSASDCASLMIPVQYNLLQLPSNIELFVRQFVSTESEELDEHIADCSEILSWPLTILYSLENGFIDHNDEITVHIVGAAVSECTILPIWELILHWLPYVKVLKLVSVGPEVCVGNSRVHVCADCEDNGKIITLKFQPGLLYKDFYTSSLFTKPDLIVAFNCGIHEFEGTDSDTWSTSIPLMLSLRNHTCLVITSYTYLEAKKDLERVLSWGDQSINVIKRCQKNPFGSRRPHRDWEQKESSVFFCNNFLSLLILGN